MQSTKKEIEVSILKGKTAVVTGSTSGIGLGCVRAFAGAGANIVDRAVEFELLSSFVRRGRSLPSARSRLLISVQK
jgi:NAD(P)-dependent dehydrogenase (short-subunit alcohol dehydrogenase family)